MSWSLYFLVAVIFAGVVLTVALFGAMVWITRRKDSEKPNA